ncbi:hypothetical protein R9208_17795 [Flammeovirgaceae bacterium SG7u.132]|nr:hypothetical protein [Flammeovirgaceae bacterium SG7u.132]
MLLTQAAKAQKLPFGLGKKVKYEQVEEAINQHQPEIAKKMLWAMLEDQQSNALANYKLSYLYYEDLKKIELGQSALLTPTYDSAMHYAEYAIYFANKKDFRKNKKYYQQELATFKPSLEMVQYHFQEYLSSLNTYVMGIKSITHAWETVKENYTLAENKYGGLVNTYKSLPNLYFKADGDLVDTLETIYQAFDTVEHYINIQNRLTKTTDFEKYKRNYLLNIIEEFSEHRVPEHIFDEKNVVLSNYGEWSRKVLKTIRQEIFPMKSRILDVDENLSRVLSEAAKGIYSNELLDSDHELIYDLFRLDNNSLAAKLLIYKRLKAEYYFLKARALDSLNTLDVLVDTDRLSKKILECKDVLDHINAVDSEISKYQQYISMAYGGADNLHRFLEQETRYVNNELKSLNGDALETNSVDEQIALRKQPSATPHILPLGQGVNTDSLLAFGSYITTHQIPLPEQEQLVAGICPAPDKVHRDAFIAKLDKDGQIFWLRRFITKHEGHYSDHKVQLFNLPTEVMLMSVESYAGQFSQHRIVMAELDGELLLDKKLPPNKFPRQLLYASDAEKIYYVTKGKGKEDRFEQLETCYLHQMNPFGREQITDSLRFRGVFTDLVKINEGFVMVGNFLEYVDQKGKKVSSQALERGGFNVMLAFFDKHGKLTEIKPLFSEKPVMAREAVFTKEGKVVIAGLQGNYIFGNKDNISGGKYWEYEF